MAGTLLNVAGVQQTDLDGDPMDGCQLLVYIGGTNTLANTYQDIGLAIPAANPLIGDASGRLPLFFVADGTYKVRLQNKFGDITNGGFEFPQVPSIGASSSGGGGSAVDPNTILATGDTKWRPEANTLAGFVRLNGRTIGNAVSGATERANADAQALFLYLWGAFSNTIAPVLGGRGANALADWNAGKQITLFDMRFRGPFGLDDMGNAAAGRTSAAVPYVLGSAIIGGSTGGEGAHALATAELADHQHDAFIGDDGHHHNMKYATQTATAAAGSGFVNSLGVGGSNANTDDATTGVKVRSTPGTAAGADNKTGHTGSGNAHNNMPGFVLGTWFMKL